MSLSLTGGGLSSFMLTSRRNLLLALSALVAATAEPRGAPS
jgi:hypothetical protein